MLTNTVKRTILQAISGQVNTTTLQPGYYMGLSITTPSSDGTNFTEPSSDAGYERIYINSTHHEGPQYPFEFDPEDPNTVRNKYEIHFNVATANWGVITHVGIFGNSGTGNSGTLLAYGHLVDDEGHDTSIEITTGHIPTIVKGQAKITIDVE